MHIIRIYKLMNSRNKAKSKTKSISRFILLCGNVLFPSLFCKYYVRSRQSLTRILTQTLANILRDRDVDSWARDAQFSNYNLCFFVVVVACRSLLKK